VLSPDRTIYEKRELGGLYETVCLESRPVSNGQGEFRYFRLLLRRGFRHQIRCHLAWIGYPIVNDSLYGGAEEDGGFLALCAQGLFFSDPLDKNMREYRINPLETQ